MDDIYISKSRKNSQDFIVEIPEDEFLSPSPGDNQPPENGKKKKKHRLLRFIAKAVATVFILSSVFIFFCSPFVRDDNRLALC